MTLNRIAEEALRDSINIPPTIHVDQGSRIMVFVRRDLDFSAFYPDPVKEALREIRHERARARHVK
jgi:type IV secretion system protein VirB10